MYEDENVVREMNRMLHLNALSEINVDALSGATSSNKDKEKSSIKILAIVGGANSGKNYGEKKPIEVEETDEEEEEETDDDEEDDSEDHDESSEEGEDESNEEEEEEQDDGDDGDEEEEEDEETDEENDENNNTASVK